MRASERIRSRSEARRLVRLSDFVSFAGRSCQQLPAVVRVGSSSSTSGMQKCKRCNQQSRLLELSAGPDRADSSLDREWRRSSSRKFLVLHRLLTFTVLSYVCSWGLNG